MTRTSLSAGLIPGSKSPPTRPGTKHRVVRPTLRRCGPLHYSLVLGLLVLSGCSLWSSEELELPKVEIPQTTPFVVTFRADEDINLDTNGRAMPVLINLFELRSPGNFELSDYFDLRDNAQARLGQDLLRSDQLMIWPGSREQRSYTSQSPTSQIGVIAGYQQLEGRTWRVLTPIPPIPLPALPVLPIPKTDIEVPLPDKPLLDPHIEIVIRQDGLHVLPTLKD